MSGSDPAAGTTPHCYRHPDRETYITCQRCGRSICPNCMRQASVGFQCPDCVRQGTSESRQGRTAFGGRLHPGSFVATYTLIAINVVFFALAHISDQFWSTMILLPDASFPQQIAGIDGVYQGSYWQLITSTFLHYQIFHIGLNMIGLWLFGRFAEMQLGRWRFVSLYLVCGFIGSVVTYWFGPLSSGTLGASGSIFGLFGAVLVVLLKRHGDVTQLLILLALNLVITFTVPDISWQAHIGGLVSGLVLGYAFAYSPRRLQVPVHVGAVAGLVVLGIVLTILRTANLSG
ncbi:MAG: rhomboid family intramembrane serine protease [Nocardioidaceae bacterium]